MIELERIALHHILLTDTVSVTLQRTLRIPDDGNEYPLPPGLGAFPVYPADSLPGGPDEWREQGGFVVPIHQREALWLNFNASYSSPHALKIGLGATDAITGEPFDPDSLSAGRQDYVVCPDQPWLDGINAGDGFIRQFVAAPLGEGLTVEEQLGEDEAEGGLRLVAFAPKPGAFAYIVRCCCDAPMEMGLGAGGRMRQEIYADEYGHDTWQAEPAAQVRVRLVEAHDFARLTGLPVPPTPVSAQSYTDAGLPWFDLYNPHREGIERSERLAGVQSVGDLQGTIDTSVAVNVDQVLGYVNGPPVV